MVNNKLQTILFITEKHQVLTISELLAIQNELETKVIRVDDLDGTISKLQLEVDSKQAKVDEIAQLISDNRKSGSNFN